MPDQPVPPVPTKLPDFLIKQPKLRLQDLQTGETAFVYPEAMVVAKDGSCLLLPTIACYAEKDQNHILRVTHEGTGFHVTLTSPWTWEPSTVDLGAISGKAGYLPVVSFSVDYEGRS